ncbi:uncharacterized protein BJ212DRAFT_1541251 [Suillus subaureus]|uniref:Uncharacterized protein n=1 Tax=Suillus subaureus TaxID=48587 RepID=A0A9P7EJK6_9AGAM|nr:uncharacterized protein BJ212DRAFT_1541251 [Suillus subaureus]KAG1822872.1 hypothetical protein BJ212DRAFT_1541251 [Suillus subaureus]
MWFFGLSFKSSARTYVMPVLRQGQGDPGLLVMSPSIMIDPVARNIAIITNSSATLTAFMVLEYICSIFDEMRLVWPRIWKTTEAKIYVVTRMMSGVPNNRDDPMSAAFSGVITHTARHVAFDLTLGNYLSTLVAVYNMYNKGGALLFTLGGAQSAVMVVSSRFIVTGTRYSPTCVIISPHYSRIYVGTSGWSEGPRAWLKLAVRDGSCTTIVITTRHQHTDEWKYHLLAGRIVLHREKFREIQESQEGGINDPSQWTQTIEVDLDDIRPFDDPEACPTSPSGLEVESTNPPCSTLCQPQE